MKILHVLRRLTIVFAMSHTKPASDRILYKLSAFKHQNSFQNDSFEKDLWEERFPAQILAAAEKLTGAASDSEIQEPEVMFSHEAQPGHKCEGKRKIGKNVCHRSH